MSSNRFASEHDHRTVESRLEELTFQQVVEDAVAFGALRHSLKRDRERMRREPASARGPHPRARPLIDQRRGWPHGITRFDHPAACLVRAALRSGA